VPLFVKKSVYDRSKLMKRAAAARSKGKHKKAIALYREVLDAEPDDADVHQKLAPLLARTRQAPEALASYQVAAAALVQKGFNDQAIGLLRGAADQLPAEVILWQGVARLEIERGRRVDAVEALVEGRSHLRSRSQRPQAIVLLLQARKLDPNHFEVSFDLAGLFGQSGRLAQALQLLDELTRRPDQRQLVRVRARQLRFAPGPGALFRYLRALILRR
jgi:tetratricopeptide (TPR) repeat protein